MTLSSVSVGDPQKIVTPKRVIGVAAACLLAFAAMRGSVNDKAVLPLRPDQEAKPVLAEKDLPKIEDVRKDLGRSMTKEEVAAMVKDLETEIRKGNLQPATTQAEAVKTKSFVRDLVEKIAKEPKYRYPALALLLGEMVLVTMVFRRGRETRGQWSRRMKAGSESEARMRESTTALEAAEARMQAVLKRTTAEERAELLKLIEKFPDKSKKILEAILKATVDATEAAAAAELTLPGAESQLLAALEHLTGDERTALLTTVERLPAKSKAILEPYLKMSRDDIGLVHLAGSRLVESLRNLSVADRAALRRFVEAFPEGTKRFFEDVLKAQETDPHVVWNDWMIAYTRWQELTVEEARILSLAGPNDFKAGVTMPELIKASEDAARMVVGMSFSYEAVLEFKNRLQHLDAQGRRATGQDLSIWGTMRRHLRNGLFITLMPIIPMALLLMYDRDDEARRRMEDANVAATQDRNATAKNLLPSIFHPMLWTVVETWKNESRLAAFKCPLGLRPIEEENPDLTVMQAIVYQAILESGVDPRNPFEFKHDEKFLAKIFRKTLAMNPATAGIDATTREAIIADMAYNGRRIYDEPKEMPQFIPVPKKDDKVGPPAPGAAGPGLGVVPPPKDKEPAKDDKKPDDKKPDDKKPDDGPSLGKKP